MRPTWLSLAEAKVKLFLSFEKAEFDSVYYRFIISLRTFFFLSHTFSKIFKIVLSLPGNFYVFPFPVNIGKHGVLLSDRYLHIYGICDIQGKAERAGIVQPGVKKRLRRILLMCVMEVSKEDRARLFQVISSERTGGKRHKLKHRKCHSNIRKKKSNKYFTVRVVKHWSRLPSVQYPHHWRY